MKKLVITLLAIGGLVCFAEARPHGGPGGRPPHRPPMHRPAPRPHFNPPKRHSDFGWGLNIGPWGAGLTIGTRIGRHGGISATIPLVRNPPPPPPVVKETVVVREPVIVREPIVVQTPVVESTKARTWVEGHWVEKRNSNGFIVSRTWVEGHWE